MRLSLCIVILLLPFRIPSADAAKRAALVIGMKSQPDLNNARTDARSMAAKLIKHGWDVILKQGASHWDISR